MGASPGPEGRGAARTYLSVASGPGSRGQHHPRGWPGGVGGGGGAAAAPPSALPSSAAAPEAGSAGGGAGAAPGGGAATAARGAAFSNGFMGSARRSREN